MGPLGALVTQVSLPAIVFYPAFGVLAAFAVTGVYLLVALRRFLR